MKIAVCTIAFNEPQYIGPCIEQWKGLVDEHLVLVSDVSWNNTRHSRDKTAEIARQHGAKVLVSNWQSEHEQRNYGNYVLKDYDYVLIVDSDEFYTLDDRKKILATLSADSQRPGFTLKENEPMKTYWKTADYIFQPPDRHIPTIAVNPNKVTCTEHRQFALTAHVNDPGVRYNEETGEINVIMHHFSWVRTDEQVKEKIAAYSHASIIRDNWYEDVWLKWSPGNMLIRPYGSEQSIAVKSPAPQEIVDLITTAT